MQKLLRHATAKITLKGYAQAGGSVEGRGPTESGIQMRTRSYWTFSESAKTSKLLEWLVDLIGIEPMTSSMPWSRAKRKLLTVKWLEVGKTGKTGLIAPL